MLFRFDGCELDTGSYQLTVAGRVEPVEPQVFDVLAYLLEHRDRVVSKEELLDNIWGNRFVSESTLTSRVKGARRAVGDDGKSQRVIRTVHGRGYQFVAQVEVDGTGLKGGPRETQPPDASVLAVSVTRLIGREPELSELVDLMSGTRLLTLTGPGGVGKTRLVAELASRVADRHPDGVWFVALTRVRDPAQVASLIVEALEPRSGGSSEPELLLREWLRGRKMLLVLDNFEHVADAAPLVSDLLRWSPDLSVLTTSRERLRLAGEQVYEVMPLGTDNGSDDVDQVPDALALFEQSAQAIDPSFAIDERNRDDVAAICRSLDGLPLALELAAVLLRVLPTQFLRDRLVRRIDALGDGMRDRPGRHQTIRATLAWSYDLLPATQQRLFDRLGVFAAPASLDAIQEICTDERGADVLADLAGLVDKSLVRRVAGSTGDPRFTMLELLREYAVEMLEATTDTAEIRRRHAAYFADLVARYEQTRWGETAGHWIDAIHGQMADIRAAFSYTSTTGDYQTAGRIAASLYGYLDAHFEPIARWTAQALEWVDVLDQVSAGQVRFSAGYLEYARGRTDAARDHWSKALAIFRERGDARYIGLSLAFVSATYIGQPNEYQRALSMCGEAIDLAQQIGEHQLVAITTNIKGEIARVHGDDELAREAYEAALQAARTSGDQGSVSRILGNLAYVARHSGNHGEARRLGRQALHSAWELGLRKMAALAVGELGGAELALGRPQRAARLIGAADAALDILGAARDPGDRPEHDAIMEQLERALGPDELAALQAEGAAMTLEESVRYALDEPPAST